MRSRGIKRHKIVQERQASFEPSQVPRVGPQHFRASKVGDGDDLLLHKRKNERPIDFT